MKAETQPESNRMKTEPRPASTRPAARWGPVSGLVTAGVIGCLATGIALLHCGPATGDAIRNNNHGAALIEQFKNAEAMEKFELVTRQAPKWAPGFANLGIAALYARQGEKAEAALHEAARLDPGLVQAHYGLALLYKNRGESDAAIAALQRARSIDPHDGQILYNLGLLHARQRNFEAAVALLREAREIDPNGMSIRYQLARALLQAGEAEAGAAEMAAYQELTSEGNFAVPTGNQYGEAGPYALVITDYTGFAPVQDNGGSIGVRFVDVTEGSGIAFRHAGPGGEVSQRQENRQQDRQIAAARYGSGVAIGDFDGDGLADLVFANAAADGRAGPALYRNQGGWVFEDVTSRSGVRFEAIGMAAALGDYDNDDDLDLVLTGFGRMALFRNRGDGSFEEVTGDSGLAIDGFAAGASWADVDHDGDIDLYVGRLPGIESDGAVTARLFLNRGDGTFQDDTGRLGLSGPEGGTLGAVFSDIDLDRDIDVVLSTPGGGAALLDNRRERGFTSITEGAGLPKQGAGPGAGRGVTAGDVDGDGLVDLVFSAAAGSASRVFVNDGKGRFQGRDLPGSEADSLYGSVLFDADNDGDLDLALTGDALRYYRNDGQGQFEALAASAGLGSIGMKDGRAIAAADLDGDGDLDLVATRNGGPPILLRNEGGDTNRWLTILPQGLNSNLDGIGTKIELQAGAFWQRREVVAGSGYLSQSPPVVHFGLGERRVADFVRLVWPGGVIQSEMDIAAGQRIEKTELDRKGSSCPLLFVWNGGKYTFVADFLGVGGLGLWLAPGIYGQPDPDEYVKIEPDQLHPSDGSYLLQVVENLEEVSYLDEVKLLAIDHPREFDVYPNESFGNKLQGPHKLYAVRRSERIFPMRAVDDSLRQVLETVMKVDRQYPDNFRLHRLAGFAEMHHLTLEFPESIEGRDDLVLFLYGWVDYEYSSTNYAAHQSDRTLTPPILEMEDDDGQFRPVLDTIGFPAGTPRMMAVALDSLGPLKSKRLRIRSNMRVYWDQIFLAPPLAEPEMEQRVKVNELRLGGAHLHRRGYPREHSPDGREPRVYDYGIMDNQQPFRTMTGNYTRFGRVTELLTGTDDRFVIFGKGEEITLEFPVLKLKDPPPRSVRSFLLFANGYCKDMDPHTAHGETVEPLPFRSMSGYPYPDNESYPDDAVHREYLHKYNTRRLEGR